MGADIRWYVRYGKVCVSIPSLSRERDLSMSRQLRTQEKDDSILLPLALDSDGN